MFRVSDLRNKDVINNLDGRKLGYIKDIEFDLHEGRIKALILPGERGFWGWRNRGEDVVIEWHEIKKIGQDVILVEVSQFLPAPTSEGRHSKNHPVEVIEADPYADWE